jgi:nucleoside-diphosphate-sugar epimerase
MRVFVTGASGFVGSAVVKELIGAGHSVLGMARSDESAALVKAAGAEVHRGSLQDLESLSKGAEACDAVIHTAFSHDFSQLAQNSDDERHAIAALGDGLAGTHKTLVLTSGLAVIPKGKIATENDDALPSSDNYPRGPEEAGAKVAKRGVRVSVVRLPQVHDRTKAGLITMFIAIAKDKGACAYVGEGKNRFAAAHVSDVARLYRLVLENKSAQTKFHAVAEEGLTMKAIAEIMGRKLNLPVVSKTQADAAEYFGWMAPFAGMDLVASSELTKKELGWKPTGPGLVDDLEHFSY